jgi:hypothetical protein
VLSRGSCCYLIRPICVSIWGALAASILPPPNSDLASKCVHSCIARRCLLPHNVNIIPTTLRRHVHTLNRNQIFHLFMHFGQRHEFGIFCASLKPTHA